MKAKFVTNLSLSLQQVQPAAADDVFGKRFASALTYERHRFTGVHSKHSFVKAADSEVTRPGRHSKQFFCSFLFLLVFAGRGRLNFDNWPQHKELRMHMGTHMAPSLAWHQIDKTTTCT